MTWETFGVVLVFAMVPFMTANPILFAYIHDWKGSAEGRAVMNLFISLALLVDFSVLFQLVPWFPGKDQIAVGVFLGLLIASMRFTVILVGELVRQRNRV